MLHGPLNWILPLLCILCVGVTSQTGNSGPSERLDYIQWKEQGALWLAREDGEEGGTQGR